MDDQPGNNVNSMKNLHRNRRIASFVYWAANSWHIQTLEAQRVSQLFEIEQQLRAIAEVLAFPGSTLGRRARGRSRILVSIREFLRGLLLLLLD